MLREKIRMTSRMYHVRPQRSIYVTSTTTIFQQVGCIFFKKIINLLHGARWQAVVDTLYLLI